MAILQTTTATAGKRDATPAGQGALRDAIIATVAVKLISVGLPPEAAAALAGWGVPVALGVGVGIFTGVRKMVVDRYRSWR